MGDSAPDHQPLDTQRTAEDAGDEANAEPEPDPLEEPAAPSPVGLANEKGPQSKFHG